MPSVPVALPNSIQSGASVAILTARPLNSLSYRVGAWLSYLSDAEVEEMATVTRKWRQVAESRRHAEHDQNAQ
jgi:hypothetical protein